MSKFTKGDKVAYTHEGVLELGVIQDVGNTLMGVISGQHYRAVTTVGIRFQTPAEKDGLKLGDVVTVGVGVKCRHSFTVGEAATFEYDDKSTQPRFEQDGETQYLDLSEITIGAPVLVQAPVDEKTPAEKAGILVGDTVTTDDEHINEYFNHNDIKLIRDDGSSMPRFGDGSGRALWLGLDTVTKVAVPAGPRPGVAWSEAPEGATHYSMKDSHSNRWHKLNELGEWAYFEGGRFKDYNMQHYAYASTQVEIPGVVQADPLSPVLAEVKELEACVRGKLQEVDALNRDVARLNAEKQTKLAVITKAGFTVQGGVLVKALPKPIPAPAVVPQAQLDWEEGDVVRCIKTEGKGVANIIVGGKYKVVRKGRQLAIIDGDGDPMLGCVERRCFVMDRRAADLSGAPSREWKAGDTVKALVAGWDITDGKHYTVVSADGSYVRLRDDVDFPRRRPVTEFRLVARA